MAERNTLASSAVTPARSTGSKLASMRPASMREKSSSVFTSFSSRRLLRCAMSSARRRVGRQRLDLLAQHVLERPQHQRQRRAELVRDVGEERGLRAIQFREALGPPPLVLERLGVGEPRGNLAGDELEERPVVGVELARRAHRRHQNGPRPIVAGEQHRQHERAGRRRSSRRRPAAPRSACAGPSAAHPVPRRRRSPSAIGRRRRRASPVRAPWHRRARCRSRRCGAATVP